MKLAIVTCQNLPHGVDEDAALFSALTKLGIGFEIRAWDAAVDWNQYDACLLRTVWDYHEHLDAFNEWLVNAAQVTEIINPIEVIQWNQNKRYLAELAEFGVTIAPTTWLESDDSFNLAQWAQNNQTAQFFLKPVVGADSSGTLKFNNDEPGITMAEKHLEQWLPQSAMMLQPFLSEVENFGETSAIYFNGSFSHAVRKIPVKGDYRVQDTFGALDVKYQPNAIEMALSKACLDFLAVKFKGVMYARFDFLHDTQGCVYLNEAELIEPSLFFKHSPQGATNFAQSIKDHLSVKDLS